MYDRSLFSLVSMTISAVLTIPFRRKKASGCAFRCASGGPGFPSLVLYEGKTPDKEGKKRGQVALKKLISCIKWSLVSPI